MAYLLLMGEGLIARRRYRPGAWRRSQRQDTCSFFTISRRMLDVIDLGPPFVRAVVDQLTREAAKWGELKDCPASQSEKMH